MKMTQKQDSRQETSIRRVLRAGSVVFGLSALILIGFPGFFNQLLGLTLLWPWNGPCACNAPGIVSLIATAWVALLPAKPRHPSRQRPALQTRFEV